MHMTLDNFWGKIKVIKGMLGIDDSVQKNTGEGMTPDEWMAAAMRGDITPLDAEIPKMNEEATKRLKQELELKRLGFM